MQRRIHPLRAYRYAHGMSAKDLGKILGFSTVSIFSFENGHRTIQADAAVRIEKKIGIDRAILRPDLFKRAA